MSNVGGSLSLLLPTLSDRLPAELIALSNSLLAQSRHHAGNLKPEEEIARPYACAEIACKRLGTKLRLPATARASRPPCAPRVYKKLLAFLERVLPTTTTTTAKLPAQSGPPGPETPKKRKRDDGDVGSSAQMGSGGAVKSTRLLQGQRQHQQKGSSPLASRGSVTTPRKKRGVAFVGKVLNTQQGPVDEIENDDGAPRWAMPLIRCFCRSFSVPSLPPHVYTGLCVVLRLADDFLRDRKDSHGQDEDKVLSMKRRRKEITGLTTALFFMVLSRMQRGKLSSARYLANCKRACRVANRDCTDAGDAAIITKDDIDDWIKQIASRGWANGQNWWDSVPEGTFEAPTLHDDDEGSDDPSIERGDKKSREATINRTNHHQQKTSPTSSTRPSSPRTEDDDHAPQDRQQYQPRQQNEEASKFEDSDSEYHLLPGLATMMHDAVDWLSRDKRADHHDWLVRVERKLARLTATSASADGKGQKRTRTRTRSEGG